MGCKYVNCKTNDKKAIAYCRTCLVINFPRLTIEDLYDLYSKIIDSIDFLTEIEDDESFKAHSPEELKEIAFHMYNDLMLKKQEEKEDG
jgi:hypothetical protein